jgi:hypothetical protein
MLSTFIPFNSEIPMLIGAEARFIGPDLNREGTKGDEVATIKSNVGPWHNLSAHSHPQNAKINIKTLPVPEKHAQDPVRKKRKRYQF